MAFRILACAAFGALLDLSAAQAAPRIAIGSGHACAITPTGGVRCMGQNGEGELGDGGTTPHARPTDTAPASDTGLPLQGVALLAAGREHTCAATAAGAVYCWGGNAAGQLGLGDVDPRQAPTRVDFGHATGPLLALAAGDLHTCAVEANGQVDCWGRGTEGQLGDGQTLDRSSPVAVTLAGPGTAQGLALGDMHSCAVVADGPARQVQCWGDNARGQLGRDTAGETAPFLPAAIGGLAPLLPLLGAGGRHTCSVDATGAPVCWGANDWGQLGVGDLTDRSVPTPVLGSTPPTQSLAAGAQHTCLADTSGVRCWGANYAGQLGKDDFEDALRPQDVGVCCIADGGADLAAGGDTSCLLIAPELADLRCWGSDYRGQFGNGMVGFRATPVFTVNLFGPDSGQLIQIAAGNYSTCVTTGYEVRCWGLNADGELGVFAPRPLSPLPEAVTAPNGHVEHIVLGAYHGCYNGWTESASWGFNHHGQIGNGNTFDQPYPSVIAPAASYEEIPTWTAGYAHTCGAFGGTLHCWGDNTWGQLGTGTPGPEKLPHAVMLANGASAAQVAAGTFQTCAVTQDAGLQCWGTALGGAGPTFATPQPLPWTTSVDVSLVALGYSHGCVLTTAFDVRCWGDNSYGQLGIGSFVPQASPVLVPIPAIGVVDVDAGAQSLHSCAIDAQNGVWCWGSNSNGQLGDGTTVDSNVPVRAANPGVSVSRVTVGAAHTCLKPDSGPRALCWGDNAYGQLGNGEHGYWPTPDGGVFVDRLFADGLEQGFGNP